MGKMSKRKGKVGELDFVNFLKSMGIEARRSVQYKGSSTSADIESLFFREHEIHPEVKRTETTKFYEWFEKADLEAGDDQTPTIFHRRNNGQWMAFLSAEDFIKILKVLSVLRKNFYRG